MKKALIYGLTLSFALTLTACGQPKAEEPGAPDPAASAAVQTASPEESTEPTATPEPSEETPTAPAETDAQPAEDTTPEEIPAEQDPEDPGETVTTQPTGETEPTATAKPTTTPSTSQVQTPPSGGGSDFVPGPGMKDPTRDQTDWSEYTPTGGQDLDGVDVGELWKNIQSGGQTQSPSSIGDPVGDLANGNWQVSTGNPEWDEIFNGTPWDEDIFNGRGDVDENGNVSNAGLNVQ